MERIAGVKSGVVFAATLSAVVLLVGTTPAVAQSAPDCSTVTYDGEGTDTNPYEVSNIEELQCIGDNTDGPGLNKSYVLTNDIDASDTSSWNSGDGFSPIGNYTNAFTGMFDGANNTIKGLYIDTQDNPVGLFGYVEDPDANKKNLSNIYSDGTGEVRDVSLVNVDVNGSVDIGSSTGALVGELKDGTVENAGASGKVSGGATVGGLIGYSQDSIVTGSYATVDVSSEDRAGGLVGQSVDANWIAESYATGDVSGDTVVGGLAASNEGLSSIVKSYATGDVSGRLDVGGLVGVNINVNWEDYGTSIIEQSYATGDVSGDRRVGGLIGGNYENVTESYATGKVSGSEWVGGLVGQNGGMIRRSYWNMETTRQSKAVGDEEGYGAEAVENVEGFATSEMQGVEAEENMQELNFSGAWKTATNPDDYPKLKWQENDGGAGGEGLPGFTIVITLFALAVGTVAVTRKNRQN